MPFFSLRNANFSKASRDHVSRSPLTSNSWGLCPRSWYSQHNFSFLVKIFSQILEPPLEKIECTCDSSYTSFHIHLIASASNFQKQKNSSPYILFLQNKTNYYKLGKIKQNMIKHPLPFQWVIVVGFIPTGTLVQTSLTDWNTCFKPL